MIHAPLADVDTADEFIPLVLPLLYEASNPYLEWFFGRADEAWRALERWVRRPSSEYAVDAVRALFDEDERLAGLYIAFGGSELARRKKADAVDALTTAGASARAARRERLAEGRALFPPVDADEFYLSRLAVDRSRRGEGFGRSLVDRYLAEGRAAGYTRFRLDVNARNAPARRLYESSGFKVVHEHSTPGGGLWYCSLVRDERAG